MGRRKIPRLVPSICEICGETDRSALHKHHIIPRTHPDTYHLDGNLAIICASCHNKVHAGHIKILDIFPATKLPYNRILVFEINGVSNAPEITEPYGGIIPKTPKKETNGIQKKKDV